MQADVGVGLGAAIMPIGCLATFTRIIMQGQGVDYMMADTSVPRDIPLVRLLIRICRQRSAIGRF